jgi:ATP-dependent Clp protease adaptor protein ClpS
MNDFDNAESDVAVMEPQVVVRPKPARPDPKSKPKRQPPYAVILHNDDFDTFQYVIELLMKLFAYSPEKAFVLTNQVHTQGKSIVWSGTLELAELKRDQVRGFGPDFYATKKVEFPLGVTIERLPE